MSRIKNVNGVNVPLTPLQEEARDLEESSWQDGKAMREWKSAMSALDEIPRWAEDLHDAMSATSQERVAKITKDKLAAKKALREARP